MQPGADIDAGAGPSPRDRAPLWIGAAFLAALVAFGAYLYRIAPPEAPVVGDGARVLVLPMPIPEYTLVDHRGGVFDRSRLEGTWSLLFFGYTYCPDVCPGTLQRLAPVQDAIAGVSPPVQVVFVSVDPERDSTERMAEYVGFFHPELVGATGDREQIARLTRAVGAFHEKAEQEGSEEIEDLAYFVDHSSSLFLVDPDAHLFAVLRDPHDTDDYAALLGRLVGAEVDPS